MQLALDSLQEVKILKMKTVIMNFSFLFLLFAILVSCSQSEPVDLQQKGENNLLSKGNGIITKTSALGFEETYAKLKSSIEANPNLKILFELDHAQNAASVDLALHPTRIIMFGNPKLGTPLMNNASYLGLDLPQKILVTMSPDGSVQVSYNNPMYLKDRHDIKGVNDVLNKIGVALDKITGGATGS